MSIKTILISLILISFVGKSSYASGDWLSDEVLNQLQELREEVTPKGQIPKSSDDDVKAAVAYMVSASQ